MTLEPYDALEQAELHKIIRQTRWRWRAKRALRGALLVAAGALATVLLSAVALEYFRFSPAAVIGFRVVVVVSALALAAGFLIRPLLQRVSDEQVALYLEEHHPTLESALVSAVHATGREGAESRRLVQRLVSQAVQVCEQADAARASDRAPLRAYAGALLVVFVAGAAILTFGPATLRRAATALLQLSQDVEAASPYRIEVQPGTTRVPRGSDQTITARLAGFTADDTTLVARKGPQAEFERLPMPRGDDGAFSMMLFDVAADVEYYVEAAGVRSGRFTLSVLDLPYVKRLDAELVPPAHAGLPPETIEDAGDLAALRGTEARLTVTTTIPAAGGRIVLDDAKHLPLERGADGTWVGRFPIDKDGFYRIELDTTGGEKIAGSPQYTIDALDDHEPSVTFTRPRRDISATPIEEVLVEAQAQDDYGVRNLQLVYSVNGAPPKTLTLFRGSTAPAREITAGHTFYLEELGVQAGDFVSYHARVSDNDAVAGAKSAMSDMYFIRVRPFNQEFKAAQSQGGGGGGQGQNAEELSEQQRRIIAGTFNVSRDQKGMTPERLRESTVVLALSQGRLREQVLELATRMKERLIDDQPQFKEIAELLPQAIEEMKAAEAQLQARKPDLALAPEQRALRLLQKAEERYEVEVTMNRNNSGGGGGGNNRMADELADLFQMELDKMANQYETRERAEQQGGAQRLDELAEKLRELSRRQEQEAERRRRQAQGSTSSGGGSAGQRSLADQAEEAARQLERLAREESRPELADAARQMQQAADAMRRAASGNAGAAGQAGAALDRLREAQNRLTKDREARAQNSLQDATREAESLAREQRDIASEASALTRNPGTNRRDQQARLNERKDSLESRVAGLERSLDQAAAEISRQQDAAKKLRDASGAIRDARLRDKIRFSKEVLRRGTPEQSQAFENDILSDLEALRDQVAQAADAAGKAAGQQAGDDTLDRAQRLARGLESLERRLRDEHVGENEPGENRDGRQADAPNGQEPGREDGRPGQPGQSGRQGQAGENGQQGQSGQQGRQGQDGQQGRSGQQGQAGEPGQGGQQGSQGGSGSPGNANSGRVSRSTSEGGGDGRGFSPDAMRQFRGEIRRWAGEARELGGRVRGQQDVAQELQQLLRGLEALGNAPFTDVSELQRLQTAVAEGARRFEFKLRRNAIEDAAPASLSTDDEVPEQFRALVEEYYRRIGRERKD